jgi:hypothetical protein
VETVRQRFQRTGEVVTLPPRPPRMLTILSLRRDGAAVVEIPPQGFKSQFWGLIAFALIFNGVLFLYLRDRSVLSESKIILVCLIPFLVMLYGAFLIATRRSLVILTKNEIVQHFSALGIKRKPKVIPLQELEEFRLGSV